MIVFNQRIVDLEYCRLKTVNLELTIVALQSVDDNSGDTEQYICKYTRTMGNTLGPYSYN